MKTRMAIIPVIDLMGGVVVHARRGDRDNYRPIESRLCPSAEPAAIVAALLELHPFETFYVADLDAIRGTGDHFPVLTRLRHRFPGIAWWLDAGISDGARLQDLRARDLATLVVGTESMRDASMLTPYGASQEMILSMDYRGDQFLGPREVERLSTLWPTRVLAMNLARVGSNLGPDLELIDRLAVQGSPGLAVFAAGGIRGLEDLQALQKTRACGALVATALHSGRLTARELLAFS
jgi:phosphoribosylformimino-5-aminoimidazole carboxamide ribotide isomerase